MLSLRSSISNRAFVLCSVEYFFQSLKTLVIWKFRIQAFNIHDEKIRVFWKFSNAVDCVDKVHSITHMILVIVTNPVYSNQQMQVKIFYWCGNL